MLLQVYALLSLSFLRNFNSTQNYNTFDLDFDFDLDIESDMDSTDIIFVPTGICYVTSTL